MKRLRSGKRLLVPIFYVMLAVTVLCLAVCGGYALYTSEQDIRAYNQAALDIYLNDLMHSMEDLQKFNEDVFANDRDFLTLSLEDGVTTIPQRLRSEMNLRHLIQSRTHGSIGILLFNANSRGSFYWFGTNFLGGQVNSGSIQKMRNIRALCLSEDAPVAQGWVSFSDGESTLLMNVFRRRDLYICSMVDIGAYADQKVHLDAIEFSFFTRDQILTNASYAQERGILLQDMLDAAEKAVLKDQSNILQSEFDHSTGIGLCGMISLSYVWEQLRVYVIMLAGALCVICVLFISMYHLLNEMLIFPLDQITNATRQISNGATSFRSEPKQLQEFMEIQTALEKLVEQKVSLAQENTRQQDQKEHALLQYYQLQTRSHFLLNCLKSIHGLVVQGEREKTINIIGLFSHHLRYVFHDSLSLVTIQAELDEVQDYFGIMEMERGDHVLLQKNIDPGLLEFKVPPLILQTFLENFNKHNAQSGKILRFSIYIDRVDLDGQGYVRIRMTDNGIGYSEKALQSLQNQDGLFEQYHVGVQNLCRRMDILYQKQYKKAFFNSPGGGAVSIFYLPAAAGDAPEQAEEGKEEQT